MQLANLANDTHRERGPRESVDCQSLLRRIVGPATGRYAQGSLTSWPWNRSLWCNTTCDESLLSVTSRNPRGIMADSQVPWGVEGLGGAVSQPAWRSRPSWYLVTTEDKMIPPDAQRAMSKRAGATVVEVKGSHAVYVSRPEARCQQRSRFATFTELADLGPGRIARRFRTMRSGYLLSQVRFETVSSCRVVTNALAGSNKGHHIRDA